MQGIGINLMVWSGQVTRDELVRLAAIRAMGYRCIELPIFAPAAFPTREAIAALHETALHCTVSTALPPSASLLTAGDPTNEALSHLRQVIEVAAVLGASIVCGPLAHPVGALAGRGYTEMEWHTAVDGLGRAAKIAADHSVTLAFEPINRFETYFLNTVDDGVRLVEAVDQPALGLLLDSFHMHIEEKSTADSLRRAAPHLRHVHASENDRGVAGTGQVPWRDIAEALRRVHYSGWVTLESFNARIPELAGATCIWRALAPDADTLARESASFLNNLLADQIDDGPPQR